MVEAYAGTLSAYLLKVVDGCDPEKVPPPRITALHTWIVWQWIMLFDPSETAPQPPFRLPVGPNEDTGLTLGDATAPSWLRDAMAVLVGPVKELCSDLAIRDWLVEHAGETNSWNLRQAALLTRHLGRDAEVPDLLARAQAAEVLVDRSLEADGLMPGHPDRTAHDPMMWSHERFMKFFNATPA
jgi:hypothetical protein